MSDFVQAIVTYGTEYDGTPVTIHRGENIKADHPLVLANPDRFKPVELSSRWDVVEQATAAPGERRPVGRNAPRVKAGGRTNTPRDPRGYTDPATKEQQTT